MESILVGLTESVDYMNTIENAILDYFEQIPHIVAVTLFGSYARNTATDKSDVDVAILCEKAYVPEAFTLIAWRENLSALIHKEIDLVCLNTASPIIGMQVYKNGKNLIVKNNREYANYQMILFSDYAELKELRAPMEKDILKRKYYDRS